jgi:hypothetical protein
LSDFDTLKLKEDLREKIAVLKVGALSLAALASSLLLLFL